MKLIGVTGSIASGKTLLVSMLRDKGALVIDADEMAREVVKPGQPAHQRVVEAFGPDILLPDGQINRRKLGDIVFNDPGKLELLNSIIHPVVMKRVDRILTGLETEYKDGKVVVADIPLLIEVGFDERTDLTIVVRADKNIRLRRLVEKGLTPQEAESRMRAQAGKEELEGRADLVVENNATVEDLRAKAEEIWKRITAAG